jgi:hypothetical protein
LRRTEETWVSPVLIEMNSSLATSLYWCPRASTSAGTAAGGEYLQRSIVIGDDLWALGYQGLYRYDLDTLDGGPAVPLP